MKVQGSCGSRSAIESLITSRITRQRSESRRLELEQDRVSRLGDLPMGPTISSKQMPVIELKEFVDYVKARPMRELR